MITILIYTVIGILACGISSWLSGGHIGFTIFMAIVGAVIGFLFGFGMAYLVPYLLDGCTLWLCR